jgi:hypothetical protein
VSYLLLGLMCLFFLAGIYGLSVLFDRIEALAGSSTAVSTMIGRGLAVATIVLSFVVFVVNYGFAK